MASENEEMEVVRLCHSSSQSLVNYGLLKCRSGSALNMVITQVGSSAIE